VRLSQAKFNRPIKFCLFLLGMLGAVFLYLWSPNKPPDEGKIIDNFQARRAAYELLRDMLLADKQLKAVYVRQGVETNESGLPHPPSELNFPVGRFNEYSALLERAHSEEVFRTDGSNPGICMSLWAAGFGGDTRHVDACWMEHVPINQVSRLDDFYETPKPRRPVFRHIDSNWYLWADW
jgi:hypothetical protein